MSYYDLAITIRPEERRWSGVVTIRATVTGASIDYMIVDCAYWLNFTTATSGGVPTTWYEYALYGAKVDLDRTYVTGETVEIEIAYETDLQNGLYWYMENDEHMIYTWSQPYRAQNWWPCKDHESDKADSLDVHITVPNNLTAVSQGILVSKVDDGTNKTFHWKHRHPIVTYNVSLNIHPYAVFSDWYTPQAGRLVQILVAEEMPAGRSEAHWDGTDQAGRSVSSGTYFAHMRSDEVVDVKPLTLIR